MAVTVIRNTEFEKQDKYENATSWYIAADGNLYIIDSAKKPFATYNHGAWAQVFES